MGAWRGYPSKLCISNLVIWGKKFSRERNGQSVSLLNHLKQRLPPGNSQLHVISIKFAVIWVISELCTVCQTRIITKTKQLIRKISWILWRSPLFQLLFLATRLTKDPFFVWFNRILLCLNHSRQITMKDVQDELLIRALKNGPSLV